MAYAIYGIYNLLIFRLSLFLTINDIKAYFYCVFSEVFKKHRCWLISMLSVKLLSNIDNVHSMSTSMTTSMLFQHRASLRTSRYSWNVYPAVPVNWKYVLRERNLITSRCPRIGEHENTWFYFRNKNKQKMLPEPSLKVCWHKFKVASGKLHIGAFIHIRVSSERSCYWIATNFCPFAISTRILFHSQITDIMNR